MKLSKIKIKLHSRNMCNGSDGKKEAIKLAKSMPKRAIFTDFSTFFHEFLPSSLILMIFYEHIYMLQVYIQFRDDVTGADDYNNVFENVFRGYSICNKVSKKQKKALALHGSFGRHHYFNIGKQIVHLSPLCRKQCDSIDYKKLRIKLLQKSTNK